jgi:hypothetical protein
MLTRMRLLVAVALTLVYGVTGHGQNFGKFVGTVTATWLDGRQMRLTEDFSYIDPSGKRWEAPKASIIDGASIPRVFWTAVGGPFEGDYRNASVVHDIACVLKKEPWRDVHLMFYNAMRCGGVPEKRALVMYAAVFKFGPRWNEPPSFWEKLGGIFGAGPDTEPPPPPPPPVTEADFTKLEQLIEEGKATTPAEVEQLLTR